MRRCFPMVLSLLIGAAAFAETPVGVPAGQAAQAPKATELQLDSLWIGTEPAFTIPLGDSTNYFTWGGGGSIVAEYRLPFFPLALARAELGYNFAPILARDSVSFASAVAGVGMTYNFAPLFGVKAYAEGGANYGFINSNPTGYWNALVVGGADVYLSLPPGFMVSLGGSFIYQVGLYMGVAASLGVSFGLGAPVTVQKFEAAPQGLPPRARELLKTGVQLDQVDLADVYPVFYKFYDDHPIGKLTIGNYEKAPIQNVKVTVWVKDYMNDPKEIDGPDSIAPGKEATVDIFALFRKDILDNTENTKTSANISVSYVLNGKTVKSDSVQTLNVLKRNSLTWDDDRKAAAFVSPNDPTAVKFAKNVASIVNGKGNTSVSQTIRLAAAIHDALTLYGLTYTSDPVATLNSDNKTVDYIQFPQQTLDYRSGKCSDFSALYASMFEAVGLETAFITIPGHIYMAVNLGIGPDDARASYTHADDLIIKDNKVWLPIEITLRTGGFVKAWQMGAKEWRENLAKKQAVLYPVRDAWKVYSPVGFSSETSNFKMPDDAKIVKAYSEDLVAFVQGELGSQEKVLQAALSRATTQAAKSKAINSLAVLHSRFGLYDQAMKELQQILAKDEYVPALLNTGNIYYMQGAYDKALELYNRAAKKAPNNSIVVLAIARANHALENYATAKKAYAQLQSINPDLAAQFSYLDLRGEEATRAADAAGLEAKVVWSDQ